MGFVGLTGAAACTIVGGAGEGGCGGGGGGGKGEGVIAGVGGADEVCCNCVGGDCSGAGFGGGGNVMEDDVVDGGDGNGGSGGRGGGVGSDGGSTGGCGGCSGGHGGGGGVIGGGNGGKTVDVPVISPPPMPAEVRAAAIEPSLIWPSSFCASLASPARTTEICIDIDRESSLRPVAVSSSKVVVVVEEALVLRGRVESMRTVLTTSRTPPR